MQDENTEEDVENSLLERIDVLEQVQEEEISLAEKMSDQDYLYMIIFVIFCLVLVIMGEFV